MTLRRAAGICVPFVLAGCSSSSDDGDQTSAQGPSPEGPSSDSTDKPTETRADTGTPTPEVIDELDTLEGSWLTYGAGNHRRKAAPDGALPETAPSRRWSISIGSIVGQPLIADGMVYAQTEAGNVFKLEGTTGSVQWVYDIGLEETEMPSIERHRLAIGGDQLYLVDQRRQLHAIDRQSGDSLWKTKVSTSERSALFFGNAVPTVVGDRVFLAEHPSRLLGFDVASGEAVVDSSISAPGMPFPTLAEADGDIYVATGGSGDGQVRPRLSKYDADGGHIWTTEEAPSNFYVRGPPVVDGDQVYLTDPSQIHAYDSQEGRSLWHGFPNEPGTSGEFRWFSPAVGTERLLYTNEAEAFRGGIAAVESSTGETDWEAFDFRMARIPPIVVGDTAVVASSDGSSTGGIYAYTLADGSRQWKIDSSYLSYVIAGDGVLLTDAGDAVSAWA